MTLLWNDIPISPRLFFLPLAELREHIPPRLLRLLCCRHPRGLLGSVLLMDERDLLDMPHFGLTFLSQLVAAVAAIEAQHGGQDLQRSEHPIAMSHIGALGVVVMPAQTDALTPTRRTAFRQFPSVQLHELCDVLRFAAQLTDEGHPRQLLVEQAQREPEASHN